MSTSRFPCGFRDFRMRVNIYSASSKEPNDLAGRWTERGRDEGKEGGRDGRKEAWVTRMDQQTESCAATRLHSGKRGSLLNKYHLARSVLAPKQTRPKGNADQE